MLDLGIGAGLEHLGIRHRTIAYCEREAYAASQLLALMEAECLDAAPVWPDLLTFPASQFRGVVDCVFGGIPCQPHSVAGSRKGTDDERWIWPAVAGIIRDSGAWLVVIENVRGFLSSGGMDAVLADLSGLGFDAEWTVLSAAEVGASHKRERVIIVGVAHGQSERFRELRESSGGNRQPDRGIAQVGHTGCERVELLERVVRAEPAAAVEGMAHAGHEPMRRSAGLGEALGWRPQSAIAGSGALMGEMADPSGPRPQGREQLATHAKDGRARTTPINYPIS